MFNFDLTPLVWTPTGIREGADYANIFDFKKSLKMLNYWIYSNITTNSRHFIVDTNE